MKPEYRQNLLVVLSIVVVTVLAYSSASTFQFNNYDDDLYVTDNDLVKRGLTPEGVVEAFVRPMAANWHPLTMVSHMVDVELFGLNAGAHHLVNVAFHLANSLLLFWVVFKMTQQLWPSAAVAVLFAIHPLHVESVAWVSERKDVLSAFFAFLTLWAYSRYAAGGRALDYILVLVFLTAGLLSKPMLVTLPVLLLLLDYWPLGRFSFSPAALGRFPRRSSRCVVLEKVPLLLLAFGSSVATVIAQNQVHAVVPLDHFSLGTRVANAIVSYVRYVGKTLWPLDLSYHYPHPGLWPIPIVVGALIFLATISLAALANARRLPWLPVGWLWFVLSLGPVIGIVQVGGQAMADRYMYLPLIGLAIIAAWSAHEFLLRRPDLKFPVAAVGTMAALALTFLTRAQAQHWQTSESLSAHALRLNSNNATAHELLALTLGERGDYAAAIRHYSEAVRIHTRSELVHFNLGLLLVKTGAILEATNHLATSLQLCPTNTIARFRLAQCFTLLGDLKSAESNYLEVLKATPNDHATKTLLGHVYLDGKQEKRALEVFSQAARQHPKSAETQHAYGFGLLKTGSVDDAILRFREAIRLSSSLAPAHRHLAEALATGGKTSEAIASYREAIRLRPAFAEAINDLAWLLATHLDDKIRNGEQAVQLATQACELTKYQQPVPLITLAAAYAEMGRFGEAVGAAERARALAEANAHAKYMQQADAVLNSARSQRRFRSS